MEPQRRLVAIMFTDIQGYTKLMQQSEGSAVEVRKQHRRIFDPTTLKYGGEIIQYYGDGTLSIFDSSVNAVKCACDLQRQFLTEPVIPVRIGIHTGDILIGNQDIIGDSVNLAARIESLGVAGSVIVSGKVAEEIGNQDDLPLKHLGAFHFKNDHRKRDVFALNFPELVVPHPKELQGKLEKNPKRGLNPIQIAALTTLILLLGLLGAWSWQVFLGNPTLKPERLAILPFTNMSNDPEDEYLVDGVHEAIISELQLAGINVKPKSSMYGFHPEGKSLGEMAQELGVTILVEGSLIRQGDDIHIDIRLIDGESESYTWTKSYQEDFQDLFSLYKDVTRSIAGEIQLALSPEVEQRLDSQEEIDPKAYDLFLRGRYLASKGGFYQLDSAMNLFNQAIAIDPSFGQPYTALAECNLLLGFGKISPFEAHTQFRINAQKAIELDPTLGANHHQLAMIRIFSEWDWTSGEEELLQAIVEDPNSPDVYDSYCQYLWAVGRTKESVKAGEKAVALDPTHHFASCDLTWAYLADGNLEASKRQLQTTIDSFGNDCPFHNSFHELIFLEENPAKEEIRRKIEETAKGHNQESEFVHDLLPVLYARMGEREKALESIEEMKKQSEGLFLDPSSYLRVYIELGDFDKAIDLLEESFLQRSFLLMYTIKMYPWYEPLRSDPRFQSLLTRMKFPASS